MNQEIQKAPVTSCKSVVFSWKPEDFNNLLKSCDRDCAVQLTAKYLVDKDKNIKILEAGCGLGKAVKYFHDRGFKNICGIEINPDSIDVIKKLCPELDVIQGDVLNMPYEKNSFDMVLSYGVIEHFPDGPHAPLKSAYDALKTNGLAIVTVPSFNTIRQIQYFLSYFNPKKYNFIRKIFKKKLFYFNKKRMGYYVDPQLGNFYEYRFTRKQFEQLCLSQGFEIIESKPIAHIDGLFHSPFRPLLKFKNWDFEVTKLGRIVNYIFSKIPFFHNHMHACVLRKK